MWLVLAFLALGLLIGNLVGLSATAVVASLVALLFAFGGGSIIAFLHKLSGADRTAASQAVLAFSLACLVGVYAGLRVSEYRMLSPEGRKPQTSGSPADSVKGGASTAGVTSRDIEYPSSGYLRSSLATGANEIKARYRDREPNFGAAAAFDSLFEFVADLGDSTSRKAGEIAAGYRRGELKAGVAVDSLYSLVR